jgi:hypothetical protein
MTGFRILVLSATVVMTAAKSISLDAQAPSPASQSPSVTVSIVLEKDHLTVGQKPWAILTIKNISHQELIISTASHLIRVHVEGKDGELSRTEQHRHIHGDYRFGYGGCLVDGLVLCGLIAPGSSDFERFDLTEYYDLSEAGKYSVYMEIYDPLGPKDGSGIWLRTNTARFKIQAPNQ